MQQQVTTLCHYTIIILYTIDPPRPRLNRLVIIFTHGVRPSVRPKIKNALQLYRWCPENKLRATTDTMHENNDHRLAGAWWVILTSPDLISYLPKGLHLLLAKKCRGLQDIAKTCFYLKTVWTLIFVEWLWRCFWFSKLDVCITKIKSDLILCNYLDLPSKLHVDLKGICAPSMIPSARPIVLAVAITILTWNLFCFPRFWEFGGRTPRVTIVIATVGDCGSANWINKPTFWNDHL